LTALGDPVHRLSKGNDFEISEIHLEEKVSKLPKGKGGRSPYD